MPGSGKKFRLCIYLLPAIMLLLTEMLAGEDLDLQKNIKSDSSLVVPGVGSENLLLDERIEAIVPAKGAPDKIVVLKEVKEIFSEIFKVKSSLKLFYNKIYYYKSSGLIVFTLDNKISVISGSGNNRITSDSVNLNNGIEHFLFNYGNSNVNIIKRDKNSIYIYASLGISLFDDKDDGVIDMYMIFKPEGAK